MMDALQKAWREERFNIPARIIGAYILWKVFHHFAKAPGTAMAVWWEHFVYRLGSIYAAITVPLLSPFVDNAYSRGIDIYITAGPTMKVVMVQDHCLAIPAMVIFAATVIFFKGTWTDKLWFIPVGLLGVALINLVRLVFVCLTFLYASDYYFRINHSFVYVALCYSFIFAMLAWWIRRRRPAAASF
ncbi:MAG: hypothetical protein JSS76_18815 [Bacteroidetes bacterium]|nr:hypothetical protein [Bacteroidota bacterium]